MSVFGNGAKELIRASVQEGLRVLSIDIPTGEIRSGMMRGLDGELLLIDLVGFSSRNPLMAGKLLTIVFNRGARTYAFATAVRAIDTTDTRPDWAHLRVELPQEIHASDRRAHVRVPIEDPSLVQVRVGRGARRLAAAELRDLSVGGLMLSLRDDGLGLLGVGDALQVELSMQNKATSQEAVIRRAEPPLYGLSFTEDPLADSANARALRSIINLLELDWRTRDRKPPG
jgi:hypothetical protein